MVGPRQTRWRYEKILIKTLSVEPRLGLYSYARQFENIARQELDSNEYEGESQRIEVDKEKLEYTF